MEDSNRLAHRAYRLRANVLEATTFAGSGHLTSCFSSADIMAVLFFHAMHFDPINPDNIDNDRFVLSKGHAAPILYAAWHELGALSHDEFMQLRTFGSPLEGHPTRRFFGTEVATGSLGIGLSAGVGIAQAARLEKRAYKTFVLLGDSELSEGCVWEAAEIAGYYGLGNLTAVVDVNRLGQRGQTIDGHDLKRIANKFEAFGWTTDCVDGHDIDAVVKAFDRTRDLKKPQAIIARTIKGFGLEAMEDKNGWHGKVVSKTGLVAAQNELKKRFWRSEFAVFESKGFASVAIHRQAPTFELVSLPESMFNIGQMVATRQAYGQALCQLGQKCSKLIVLDAEVSNSTGTADFAQKFPNQFIECFIAEQNMVGMASGLASRGFIPFVSTFGAFFTRAFDQIRMAGIGQLPLRLVGSHAGVSIGQDGPSQMGLEDMAMIGIMAHSVILYPADAVATHACVQLMANYHEGISYLRTARQESPVIYENSAKFCIGGFNVLRSGNRDRVLIVAAGATLTEAFVAYQQLMDDGISVAIIDLYGVKPIDSQGLRAAAVSAGAMVVTVEDHHLCGGFGQSVAQVLSGYARVICLAVDKAMRSGSPQELRAYAGIDSAAIVNAVKFLLS